MNKPQKIIDLKENKNDTNKRIIDVLFENDKLNLGEIVKKLKISPQAGTKHLLELKYLGIVRKIKNTTLFELNNDILTQT